MADPARAAAAPLLDGRRVEVFSIPMVVGFRGIRRREGVLIWGREGVGEFSPFWEYDDAESAAWLAAALESSDRTPPPAVRSAVPVNCTVPAVGPERAAAIVTAGHGCRTAKVKVAEPGQTLDHDVARVAAVRAALGSSGRIRVDANGAWTVAQAVEAVGVLAEYGLEYVEQPTATVEGLREVRGRVGVPVAADESIRRARDPLRVARLEAADVAVIKVQPLGGPRSCLRLAERLGLPVVVSSALETAVGIAAGVAVAAALPELPYACGLATGALLEHDVVTDPFQAEGGALRPRAPRVDTEQRSRWQADGQTAERWRARVTRCARELERRS